MVHRKTRLLVMQFTSSKVLTMSYELLRHHQNKTLNLGMGVAEPVNKLSNLQLELLKIFSSNLPDEQLLEIKELLSNYFAQKATAEMDRLWDERGWSNEIMQEWLHEQ